ncbi:hypothetical protein [Kribbella sp. ALI-6-A]|uniref:hypothetical protein n=1 Tax=Kribbella sp. ALI-6-A TaxID=1933817 RepID=UPI001179CF79|nr:hypothetical protein [Kribbella sp. ALI-6-A]
MKDIRDERYERAAVVPVSPRAVDKRARPGNEGGTPATEPAADLTGFGQAEEIVTAGDPVEADHT